MPLVNLALLNFEAGGLRRPGQDRDLQLHIDAFHLTEPAPALLLNEAKYWREDGSRPLHQAAELLADRFDTPYVGLLGHDPDSPMPPAIIYDPTVLILRTWPEAGDPHLFADKRNVAFFAVRDSGDVGIDRVEFGAAVTHWTPHCGIRRRQQAALLDRYGTTRQPVIIGGDLNSTASGPHLPQRDWAVADYRTRAQKGRQLPDGTWTADTDAVDHLIGSWNPHHQQRIDGCGFHALADLAWHTNPGVPLLPTVNDDEDIDVGGGLLIDWLLVNNAMLPHIVTDSYRVHTPRDEPPPSDHRLVTATLTFPKAPPRRSHLSL